MPFAADDSVFKLISQFVFVGLMIVAWVLRKVTEKKGRSASGARPPPEVRTPPVEQARTERDVTYGTRTLAHPPRRTGARTANAGSSETIKRRSLTRSTSPKPPPAPTARMADRESVTAWGHPHEAPLAGLTQKTDAAYAIDTSSRDDRQHGAARARLGIPSGRDALRTHTRMAMRWMEILGPPRALRGPHRPPSVERFRSLAATRRRRAD